MLSSEPDKAAIRQQVSPSVAEQAVKEELSDAAVIALQVEDDRGWGSQVISQMELIWTGLHPG